MIRFHYVVIRVDGDKTCNLLSNNYNLLFYTLCEKVGNSTLLTHLLNTILYSDAHDQ
jgi:hypothetical protein